jgi:membrane-bound serine protease (ClpP class)
MNAQGLGVYWLKVVPPSGAQMIRILSILSLLAGILLTAAPVHAENGAIRVLQVQDVINPVTAGYIVHGIESAERSGASAVVIELDTPGGLESSMREIVQRINIATVPVVVYVWPPGGRAASAGAFITMAGHVAAMAPNTSIGAAHPVSGQGEAIEGPLGEKVTNDAVAFIRGIAHERGRNEEWAEQAVRESVSVPDYEAVQLHIVDLTASDLNDLLNKIDGRSVSLSTGSVVLHTSGARIENSEMSIFDRFLLVLSDPNIAFLLLSVGMLGIVFEVLHPGAIFPGVFGAIALLLAFFSLDTLPFSWAGVALIALAFVFFVLELFITSHGVLGIGGAIALAIGGSILVSGGGETGLEVSRWLIVGLSGTITLFFILAVGAIMRSQRQRPTTGEQGLVGRLAEVRTPLAPKGMVFINGELWEAITDGSEAAIGQNVEVVSVEGLRLHVTATATQYGSGIHAGDNQSQVFGREQPQNS